MMKNFQTMEFRQNRLYFLFIEKNIDRLLFFKESFTHIFTYHL